ncbi:hypothetical protein JG687_00017390, partial [Phytophthora cactorum]
EETDVAGEACIQHGGSATTIEFPGEQPDDPIGSVIMSRGIFDVSLAEDVWSDEAKKTEDPNKTDAAVPAKTNSVGAAITTLDSATSSDIHSPSHHYNLRQSAPCY